MFLRLLTSVAEPSDDVIGVTLGVPVGAIGDTRLVLGQLPPWRVSATVEVQAAERLGLGYGG